MVPYKKPNTVVLLVILMVDLVRMLCESVWKGLIALFSGHIKPLRRTHLLRVWHWMMVQWPKRFWRFPTAIQIGRIPSTLIQIISHPLGNEPAQKQDKQ